MPAGGTLLTITFGGSRLTEFDRLGAVALGDSWAFFASRDSCMNSTGFFSAVSASDRLNTFVFSVLINPLFRGTASSSGSLIAARSRSVLYAVSKLGMDVMA